ncbi:unnamed protein product [Urochloa decumbens]|uniref:F-box domain-containing protein n=1 Tax=Urochloa decumbens TaxID=240449 RepID=A0ABC9ETE2_9POAL
MDEDRRRRSHGPADAMDTDCISGLPDELLHDILLRLESTRAAARTSVLSRRWRHVWAHLPELIFNGDGTDSDDSDGEDSVAAAAFLDTVDGALRTYSAPTIERIVISLPSGCPAAIPARRVGSWLRFASRHQVRTLSIDVPWLPTREAPPKAKVLVLPTFGTAQDISLDLGNRWQLRIRPASVFRALTDLRIRSATMEARVLEALVGSQCARLSNLDLTVTLVAESDISLRSDSLETLSFCVDNTRRVEIIAPRMEELSVSQFYATEARISAPKLAELVWEGNPDAFGSHIQFDDASRHLRVLEVSEISSSLMQRFDKVDELRLVTVDISKKIGEYNNFVNDTNNLPKCATLSVSLYQNCHGFAPSMLQLLRKCNSVTSFTIDICWVDESSMKGPSCPLPCPCRLPESCKLDDITLDSLKMVAIHLDKESHEVVEFVKRLSQCNAAILKKVVIYYFNKSVNKRFCAKVRAVCRPNIKVKFIAFGSD